MECGRYAKSFYNFKIIYKLVKKDENERTKF